MAQHEQQPEEAITKPLAAAAQGAGSYAQSSMYGRALSQRGRTGDQPGTDPATGRPTHQPGENGVASTGKSAEQPEPDIASTLTRQDDPGLRQLIGQFDPAVGNSLLAEQMLQAAEEPSGELWGPKPPPPVVEPGTWTFAETPAADDTPSSAGDPSTEEPAAPVPDGEYEILPVDGDDAFLLAAGLDSAAAQQRLQVGQVEPPPLTPPPGPALGPGPV
jgi:hypothetical protein